MTLSHRWGSAHVFKLRRYNHARLLAGFSATSLPQCFQDAIEVTQALGVRYLWIDSLCIIQDEDYLSDWARESSMMDKVYANPMVNIS